MTFREVPQRSTPISEPVPCRVNPDQWFSRANQAAALAGCLACPYRRRCAQHALQSQPSWGMWAGIWINGRFAAAAAPLQAVAADYQSVAQHQPEPPRLPPSRPRVSPAGVRCTTAWIDPRTLVYARAEGFCEILAHGCRLTADAIVSRVPSRDGGDASTLFSVCQECAITLECMDFQLVRRLGYRVVAAADAAATPFLWRQKHRLLLDGHGGLRRADASAAPGRLESAAGKRSSGVGRTPHRVAVSR
jgi:hypothetical protein